MTTHDRAPKLKLTGYQDYVFVLEDLEPAFRKEQLEQINYQWNNGMEEEDIARFHKRDPDEIFLALFHLAREGKIERPFAYRRRKT